MILIQLLYYHLYIYLQLKVFEPDEIVAVMPVDPYVEDKFFHHVKSLDEIVQHSKADIALVGIEPTFPLEKYGYILPDCSQKTNIEGSYRTW